MIRDRFTSRFVQLLAPRRGRWFHCFRPRLELLEDRTVPAVVTVDATSVIRTVNDQVLGVNLGYGDSQLGTPATLQLVEDAGLRLFRQPEVPARTPSTSTPAPGSPAHPPLPP